MRKVCECQAPDDATSRAVANYRRIHVDLWGDWKKAEAYAKAAIEADNRKATEAAVMGTTNRAPGWLSANPPSTPSTSWQSIPDANHQPEPTTMNSSTAIFLVTDKVRAIRVAYDVDDRNNNPGYLFKTFDASIKKDDLVVVPTNTRHGFTICKVTEVDCDVDYTGGGVQYKWIAGKFDDSAYKATLEQEQDIIDKVNRAERARKRQELAAALKLDEVQLGDNPLLLGSNSASATTTTES